MVRTLGPVHLPRWGSLGFSTSAPHIVCSGVSGLPISNTTTYQVTPFQLPGRPCQLYL